MKDIGLPVIQRLRLSVVQDYADVEKCVRHICNRARACITKTGGQFERGLNRLKVKWDGDK